MKHRHHDGNLALRSIFSGTDFGPGIMPRAGDKTQQVHSTRVHQEGGGRGRRAFQVGFPWKAPKRGWQLQMAKTWRRREKEYPGSNMT